MKKIIAKAFALVMAMFLLTNSVFAAENILIYGNVSGMAKDITILALDKNADINNIKNTDIKYINQTPVTEDGFFTLSLPLMGSDDLIVRTNAGLSVYDGVEKDAVYVSAANGNDNNNGATAQTAYKTLEKAYTQFFHADKIVLVDDTDYVEPPEHDGELIIKGNTPSVKLNLPSDISLKGALTIDNLTLNGASTIFANGNPLKITETVDSTGTVSSGRLTVYGGTYNARTDADVHLTLLGGKYSAVYGGGHNYSVFGDVYIVFGGNANAGMGINDKNESDYANCMIYGGGNNSSIQGKANITLEGNAVASYLVGTGPNNSTAKETNIVINGGKVMNVYGGSKSTTLENCNTNITMNGGVVESLFGGSEKFSMTGNTYITVNGGEVLRRIYSGCYNDTNIIGSFESSHHVNGTTTLAIGPNANLITKNGLASTNKTDLGISAGSRGKSNHNEEVNTIIYLDNSYSQVSEYVGDAYGANHQDYEVRATAGGKVLGTTTGGTVKIIPNVGYNATAGGVKYEKETEVSFTSSPFTVTFEPKAYNINSMTAVKGLSSISTTVNIMGSTKEQEPMLWVGIYDGDDKRLLYCQAQAATEIGEKTFDFNFAFEEGKKYIIEAYMWNGTFKPLTTSYILELK